MKYILVFLTVLLLSCKPQSNKFIIGELSFVTKGLYVLEPIAGIDSYSALLIKNTDTIFIEYGDYGIIDDLYSRSSVVAHSDQRKTIYNTFDGDSSKIDGIFFSDYPEIDNDQKIFELSYYTYDTINNIICKIVRPKKRGIGIIGVYIPKLRSGKSFSMYTNNTMAEKEDNILEIFKTINYKQ
jgi:hypothetical protein